jgi:Haem-dependent oxidative N-demethylase, alpha subunit-like
VSTAESEITSELLWSYAPDTAQYEAAGTPAWLDELELTPAPPHVKMLTRSLGSDWLIADRFRDMEVALRNRLLDEQHELVFAMNPVAEAAAVETLELVEQWLSTNGLPPAPAGFHPLEAAGRAIQEDLCLMVRRDGSWHLDGAVLCFPSFWSLTEKFGRPTIDVHQGVAHYDEELAPRVDRFFDRMRSGQTVWRRNLSVKPYPLLFVPLPKRAQPVGDLSTTEDGSPFWLRSEWQTLQLLPRSSAILFTIKLQLAPARVLMNRRDRAADLLAMYRSWDEEMVRYKIASNNLAPGFIPWLERLGLERLGLERLGAS